MNLAQKATNKKNTFSETTLMDMIASYITASLFFASFVAAVYTKEWGSVFSDWVKIMTGPGPLVTDYYMVGGLASTFLNAGMCGLVCILFMTILKGKTRPNALAGYFLVIAHCFYGLNLLNMMPCFLTPILYFKAKKLNVNDNLHVCMFATCFGPFISELLFRYTQGVQFVQGEVNLTLQGILLTIVFAVMLGFVIPAILPGARAWHKGYNLFNGGLAFGIFGFFAFNFMYTTFGIERPVVMEYVNPIYDSFNHSYGLFVNVYYLILFSSLLFAGYLLNGCSFKGYREMLKNTGHLSNFYDEYGIEYCLLNMGFYGLMFLFYINFVMFISKGAGFTGPTTGIIFAAMTFTMLGQHPRNVWPILAGFIALFLMNVFIKSTLGIDPGWTVSSQAFINASAFATGICPITGRYGKGAGFVAGIIDASLCRSTTALHGGLVLYNGGFVAGLTVLILLPILEHYVVEHKYVTAPASMSNFIVVEEKKQKNKLS